MPNRPTATVDPGSGSLVRAVRERHPDRIYHRVVSYYVSAGSPVPMTAGEFYSGLESHYNERDGMYFRPDQVEPYERKKMTFKALAEVDLFVTDEKSAVAWLRQTLKLKPKPLFEIQPEYLQEIATGGERPDQLPDLRELLEQNFIQDPSGAWAVPDPRKVEHLEQMRDRDLLRTFDTYATGSGMLGRFRGEAVLAGFKKAWAANDYDVIVKVAGRLPQDYLVRTSRRTRVRAQRALTPESVSESEWRWWPEGHQVVQVLDRQELFGEVSVDVYAPGESRVRTVGGDDLLDLSMRPWRRSEILAKATALRVLSEAESGHPIAAGTRVDLLPHQVAILQRALRLFPVRLAICCEVGLGKTATAGAVLTELLARARISRVLVVAPKGVQLQWVAEMSDKFGLDFTRIGPEGVPIDAGAAVWRAFDLAVTSLDAIKPLRRRAGWTDKQLAAHNAARAQGAVNADWDLVIIDEAHHVAGSTVDVARHQLALDLAERSPHLLLLTATPHSGKSESFRRFLGLLDEEFRRGADINARSVAAVVARTDKRTAVDHSGQPLFHPRTTRLEVVPWAGHPLHRSLYEAVTEYVREGYLNARATGDTARGFLMLLFQRLVASSSAAIVAALEKRLEALAHAPSPEAEQLNWDELDEDESQALLARPTVSEVDVAELSRLIDLAKNTLSAESDPKTVHFLRLLRLVQRDEQDPDVKILVFTQFRATQRSIVKVLESQGVRTVTVDGTMGITERAGAQAAFRAEAQVLISTDAGGEGVNLQFAHVIVNWDLPWTPTLLEQRIGRVDRIGQQVPVRAFNFALEESVDQRVLEVLEIKLAVILQELGVDKRGDVLATVDGLTDSLYVTAIIEPGSTVVIGRVGMS